MDDRCPVCLGAGKVPQVIKCPNFTGNAGDHSCARCMGKRKIVDLEGNQPQVTCSVCHGTGKASQWAVNEVRRQHREDCKDK